MLPVAIKRREDPKSSMLILYYLLYFGFCCLSASLVSRIKSPVNPDKNHKFVIFCILLHVRIMGQYKQSCHLCDKLTDSPILEYQIFSFINKIYFQNMITRYKSLPFTMCTMPFYFNWIHMFRVIWQSDKGDLINLY